MKIALIILLAFAMYFPSQAQNRGKYKIKVVEHNHKRHRGIFYAANDNGLILYRRKGDTTFVKAENISALYISRPGIVVPMAVIGGVALFIVGATTPGIDGAALAIAGVPLGVAGGLLLSQPFANKRYYRKLEAKDFPLIKSDLRKYTVVK
ncbi:hypothetical protein ABIB40_000297 [Pedobacter sp. UYP30]|uniref:hypothetical protein n=1 Tax=Pedobacter sp. UYP30 TaxID=1756400 RepID=UPI0033958913